MRQYYAHLVLRTLRRFSEVKENVGLAVGVVLLLSGGSIGSYFGAVPWWVVPSLGFALFLYLALRTNYDEIREREAKAEAAEQHARQATEGNAEREQRVDAVQTLNALLWDGEALANVVDEQPTTFDFDTWTGKFTTWREKVRVVLEPLAPGKWAQLDQPLRISRASFNGQLLPQAKADLTSHYRRMIADLRAMLGELG